MDIGVEIKRHFKNNISYVLFTVLVTVFLLSLMFNLCYVGGCGLIPFWVDLVPALQTYFGIIMAFLVFGIIFTEYLLE
ncbi:hypothetical protein [Methanococcus sp. CF]